ncbi:MAG: TonB-dependent receptor [Capsulimonadaceae bacterium]|nr:TonB-dependent receptor [Capsulimonadaceae bacterium]
MYRSNKLAIAAAWSVALCLSVPLPRAAAFGDGLLSQINGDIFDPNNAPLIVVHVTASRAAATPKYSGTATTITQKQIADNPNQTFVGIVSKAPGVAVSSSGEIHVRGSHGQYTYYLDGAPLPASVSGSFEELINPKNIQTLNIYTGGFPASFGDNLAAVFDVTAKAGDVGSPHGSISQEFKGNATFETTEQIGGGENRFTYFFSGLRNSTNRQLDPVTNDPIHDAGNEAVLFGKFDYLAGRSDQLIFDTAHTDSYYQIPNTAAQQAIGIDDTQKENGNVANLIWRHTPGADKLVLALYSHASQLRYFPSSADLIGASADNPLASAFEDRTTDYYGVRIDYSHPMGGNHVLGIGTDNETVTGDENFNLVESIGGKPTTYSEVEQLSGNDRSAYIQDDWSPGRWRVNYGARYDMHKTDTDTSQISPRLNMTYIAGRHDKFHADYDREFQPVAVEDVRKLDSTTEPFKPERDNFYEAGYQHDNAGYTETFSAYYKTEQDVVDENTIAGTIIPEPFNVQRGYVRGLEWTLSGPLAKNISFYGNYARSWAQSAGDFTGGFIPIGASPNYFYDDHDQTDTASTGLTYEHNGTFLDLDGEYGSGFPYGQNGDQINYIRTEPHFIIDSSMGATIKRGTIEFTVINLLNHPYIITQGGVFSTQQWGQGRTFGVKYTYGF